MVVLVIDDDPEEFELFCDAIGLFKPRPECVYMQKAEEALEGLRNGKIKPPDYIFLDINMPAMDGREFLIRIKKDANLKSIPVVMFSTTSNTKDIENFKTLGAKDFLVKPNSIDQLVASLKKILK